MTVKHSAALCALITLWMCASVQAAQVRAWLDRSSMQMGETVTLNVEVSGDTHAAQPDFGALTQDFDLLGTQSSTSVNIVNGQTTSKLLWAVGLQPKHAGTLTVPGLSVAGTATQPLTLTVQAAAPGSGGKTGDDVYIETTVEPKSPYVQQEVRLTVKLYYALNLTDGGLDDPKADGVVVRKLGQGTNYSAEVAGRNYRVVERHYALLPEKSGNLTIPAIAFRGHAVNPGDINSFFSNGRSVSAHANPITLDVRPRPAVSGNDAWLPARSLTLTANGIDASTAAKVGEPLTLTLRLQAQGLGFEQLPELKLPRIDGADVYPDKPSTQNRDDGDWIFGERVRKFAIVPNRAGTLTLPAISVDWWDTAHDEAQTAHVPALTLHVAAAAGTTTPPAVTNGQTAANATSATALDSAPVAPAASIGGDSVELRLWRRLAFFAMALWALTLAAWIGWLLLQRRRRPATASASAAAAQTVATVAAARMAFQAACLRGDWPATARALLAWAQLSEPGVHNLGELARLMDDPAQVAALGQLERACYGNAVAAGLADTLKRVFARGPALPASKPAAGPSPVLPNLYPFKV